MTQDKNPVGLQTVLNESAQALADAAHQNELLSAAQAVAWLPSIGHRPVTLKEFQAVHADGIRSSTRNGLRVYRRGDVAEYFSVER